ncbi:TVP38/TMEM64 family protein [Kibdelosporangium persicum]|uniref:TVP38/TMEM64 family membrane protein n=1 Tax=Kibdelosporangium persicum TaxID=2698649 RepID=A0ABX2F201_9PSEU|nr:TVP38/TMEM64 family protein [Kibdelosporangium persicum]NRN65335.1 DedA family protein-like [Kibdelosporangium persicum]
MRDPRLIVAGVLLVALIAVAFVVPQWDPGQIRDWAGSAGSLLPLLFFVAHALATIAIPRIPFTLSAGLLFGPVTGTVVAVCATTVSAALAFLLVRAIGRDAVAARLTHPGVAAVNRRLARRGWLAVGSLRLIGPVPFPLVNFCAGVSSVRLVPFLAATAVGVVPGTVAVVALGDALTGRVDPAMVVVTAVLVVLGVVGLIVDARLGVKQPAVKEPVG